MARTPPLRVLACALTVVGGTQVAPLRRGGGSECECLNWKEVYKTGAATCGLGAEFFFLHGETAPKKSDRESAMRQFGSDNGGVRRQFSDLMCGEFFEGLDSNRCVDLNMGKDEGQWCYVDAGCKDLNAGARVPGTQLSVKRCRGGKDARFQDLTPEDLYRFAQEKDVRFTVLQKMSYPGARASERHPISLGELQNPGGWPSWLKIQFSKAQELKKPYFWDTNGYGTLPHIIIDGGKLYLVEENPEKDPAHFGTWETLRCLAGCDGASPFRA